MKKATASREPELPDGIELEQARYPPRHLLCVDALSRGYFESFLEFFRISHPPTASTASSTAAAVQQADEGGSALSDDTLRLLQTQLCTAEEAAREGAVDKACVALFAVADVFSTLGNFEEENHFLQRAVEVARSHAHLEWEARATRGLARAAERQGDGDAALRLYEDALRLAVACGHAELLGACRQDVLSAYAARADALQSSGQAHAAVALLRRSVEVARDAGDAAALGRAHYKLGAALEQLAMGGAEERARSAAGGRTGPPPPADAADESIQHFLEYLADARHRRDAAALQHACQSLATAYGRRGQWQQAEPYLREALQSCRDECDADGVARVAGELGACLSKLGRFAEATEMYQEQFDVAMQIGDKVTLDAARIQLGLVRAQAALEPTLQRLQALMAGEPEPAPPATVTIQGPDGDGTAAEPATAAVAPSGDEAADGVPPAAAGEA